MKITLKWLQKHIKFYESDLKNLLSSIETECIKHGMELDGFELINPILQVHVTNVETIPGMKVRKCTVDLTPFDGLINQPNTVLCGGVNARTDMYTLMCPLNTTLRNGLKIVERKIKNEVSYGMLMSASEANVNLPCEDGCILDLNDRTSKIYNYEDVVLNFKVPFHRWDLHCVRGIARSLQNIGEFLSFRNTWKTDFDWKIPVHNDTSVVMTFGEVRNIDIVDDVRVFMKRIGKDSSKSLQMLNDFVLLDIGHPIAIYDIKHIDSIQVSYNSDQSISIRNSHEIICDGGIRNIRGYDLNTKDVVIEAGYFHKENINSLRTDSAYRFWLGVDNEQMTLEYVYNLITGERSTIYYGNGIMPMSKLIKLPIGDIYKYTGLSISAEHAIDMLKANKFVCKMERILQDDNVNDLICIECKCPSWRKDIVLPIDIVEEIARLVGYDKIKTQEQQIKIGDVNINFVEQLKLQLCALGLNEIYKFPFTSQVSDIVIQNPINSNESYMRNTLFYSMYDNVSVNNWNNRFFTYDTVYTKVNGEIVEEKYLGILINGRSERFWNQSSQMYTFFDLKQIIQSLGLKLNECKGELPDFAVYGLMYEEGYIVKIRNTIAEDTYFAQIKVCAQAPVLQIDTDNKYTDVSIKCNKSVDWLRVTEVLKEYNFYLFDVFENEDYIKYGITFVNTDEIPEEKLKILSEFN